MEAANKDLPWGDLMYSEMIRCFCSLVSGAGGGGGIGRRAPELIHFFRLRGSFFFEALIMPYDTPGRNLLVHLIEEFHG